MVWLMIPQYLLAAGKFSPTRVSSPGGEQICDGALLLIVFGGALIARKTKGGDKRSRQLSGNVSGEKCCYFLLAGIRIRFTDFDEFLDILGIEHDHAEPVKIFRLLSAEPAG